jgi:PAS domain S-box-containing protein
MNAVTWAQALGRYLHASRPSTGGETLGDRNVAPEVLSVDLATILDGVGVALYVTDADGRLAYYNEAAANLWGWHPPLLNTLWSGAFKLYTADGASLPHDQSPMAVALKTGQAVRGVEAIAERPDGSRVPFIPFPTPLRDTDGRVVGAVNVLVDISRRKQAEARAAQAAVAKTRFLAAMTHEFRTPIHAVLGFADVLSEPARRGETFRPEHVEYLAEIGNAGRHLLDLVTDAIAFAEASIADARPVAIRRQVTLGSLISDALSITASALSTRAISIVQEGPAADTSVVLDPPAAKQALLGVVREAARHIPAGGAMVLAWWVPEGREVARIDVRCPGLRLPPDLISELDRPFAGADRDIYSRGLEGAGLSVATAAALLRGHGGQLTISAEADGTPPTFHLTLPLTPVPSCEVTRQPQKAPEARSGVPATPAPSLPFSLADVVAAARDIVVVTAADLDAPGPTIVYVNPAFTALTGYSAEEVLGRTPRMLQGPGTNREVLRRLGEDLRAGREARATVLNYGRDGTPYWLEMHVVPIRNGTGAITHFAAIERVTQGPQPASVGAILTPLKEADRTA